MKGFAEIKEDKRIQINQCAPDGMQGWITLHGSIFVFVCSIGGGWDHVSVSNKKRCPTWQEMCEIKDIFFNKNECCVEYHPAERDYVNIHPNCLHIWKPRNQDFPKPPKIFV